MIGDLQRSISARVSIWLKIDWDCIRMIYISNIYLDINLFVGQHFAAWTFSTEAHRTISSSFDLEIEDLMIESIHWYSLNTMLYDRSFWKWTFISGCCIRILMISSITIEFTVWYSYLIVYSFTVCLQSGQSVHCSNELKETIWIGCWKR